jgi:GNAT superfamily N-acetyltransferase
LPTSENQTKTTAFEPLGDLLADGLEEMLFDHWQEVGLDHDAVPLAPDWEHYRRMEKEGTFRIIALRQAGALIGYSAFFVNRHLHYRHTLHAVNDYFYVAPERRSGWVGVQLFRDCERMMADLGVVKIMYHIKPHVLLGATRTGNVGRILLRLGYRHAEDCYSKILRG